MASALLSVLPEGLLHHLNDGATKLQGILLGFGLDITLDAVRLLIVLSSVVIPLLLLRFCIRFSSGGASRIQRGRAVLILGQCDAGKTALFFYLRTGALRETVSSLESNRGLLESADNVTLRKPIEAIDFPGHQRHNLSVFPLIRQCGCIVYLIDSSDKASLKPAAEHIFTLLTNKEVHQYRTPMLIACNKMDLPAARTVDQIRDDLAREIEKLRNARALSDDMHTTAESGDRSSTYYLGVEGLRFTFDCSPVLVEFAACSVCTPDVSQVVDFVERVLA